MKIFLWIVATLAAGFLLLCVAVMVLLDSIDLRGRISAEVEQKSHRKLAIGEIHVGVFPTLGARVKNLSLSNAPGFGDEPLAQVGEAQIGVRILPLLFDHQLAISKITLKDLHLNLIRHADGSSNWEDLNGPPETAQPPQTAQGKPGPNPAPHPQPRPGEQGSLRIGGIDIDNANIRYVDERAKQSFVLDQFSLNTGAIAPGRPFDFKLAYSVTLADPAIAAQVQASARFDLDDRDKLFDMQNLQAAISASGAGVPGGKQELKLSGSLHCDGKLGSFKLSDGKLVLDNIVAALALDGSGLAGDAGHIGGQLSVASFNPRDAFKAAGLEAPRTADPNAMQQASLSAVIDAAKGDVRFEQLKIMLDQSTFTGSAALNGTDGKLLRFALKLDQIDADRYLAPAERNPLAPHPGGKPGEGDNAPMPLERLEGYSADGTVEVARLKLKNLNLTDARFKLATVRGAQKTIGLDARLYGGTLASVTHIGPGARPTVAATLKLDTISAGPLLQDLTGKESISGKGNLSLDLTSAGASVNELKRGLNGTLSFALQDGAVKGFNLGQLIRRAQALQSGQPAPQDSTQQTDFSSMSASGKIANGVLHSDDLAAASPLLRLSGTGQVDLAANTIDYTAKPTFVNTAGGQGGKDLSQLQGIVVPVHLTGVLTSPKYQIDVAAVLQQEAVQKLVQKLNSPKAQNIINNLQGLFGKKKQDQQSPQPEPQPQQQ